MKIVTTLLTLTYFAANLWHGAAHEIVEVPLTDFQTAFVILFIGLLPALGCVAIWTRYWLAGLWLTGTSMVLAFIFGLYYHYIQVSIDHVEHLPTSAPAAHDSFVYSAALIAWLAGICALNACYFLYQTHKK